jgi:hypothetical protein
MCRRKLFAFVGDARSKFFGQDGESSHGNRRLVFRSILQGPQFLRKCIGPQQIACLKTLAESIVNCREQFARCTNAMLIPPQSREAGRGSQFP